MKNRKQDVERNRKVSLLVYVGIVTAVCLYAGLHLGVVYRQMQQPGLFGALAEFGSHMLEHPFPCSPLTGLWQGCSSLWES